MRKPHPADLADLRDIPSATSFIASLFLGRGEFAKAEAGTLEAARAAAASLAQQHPTSGRKPMVYGILPNGRQVLIPETYQQPETTMSKKPSTKKSAAPKADGTVTVRVAHPDGVVRPARVAATAPQAQPKRGRKEAAAALAAAKAEARAAKAAKKAAPPAAAAAPQGAQEATKGAKKAAAPRAPSGKRAAILAAAQAGKLPSPPDFSAETHKRFRPKLAELVAWAEAGDLKALRAWAYPGFMSTSPKAMQRYRDLCIVALEAKPGAAPAAAPKAKAAQPAKAKGAKKAKAK